LAARRSAGQFQPVDQVRRQRLRIAAILHDCRSVLVSAISRVRASHLIGGIRRGWGLARPRQKEKVRHDKRVRIIHVLASRPINLVELALIHHAAGQELGSHASHKIGSDGPPRMP
jgi:hypothetical protein